ncbi:hypothetical protein C0J52_14559 [Blattella germanica]|nr:hypothetical protein C0J52_14559 [Blattella germanica]
MQSKQSANKLRISENCKTDIGINSTRNEKNKRLHLESEKLQQIVQMCQQLIRDCYPFPAIAFDFLPIYNNQPFLNFSPYILSDYFAFMQNKTHPNFAQAPLQYPQPAVR